MVVVTVVFLRSRLFTVSEARLTAAAAAEAVKYDDRAHSFVISPVGSEPRNVGVIFYPGAMVDSKAYAPKLSAVASSENIKIFIVKPYLRLAKFNVDAAKGIIEANPEIKTWYLGGHSMGGGAACSFSNKHPNMVKGLFLFASYCSSSDRNFAGPTLALVGSNDVLETPSKVQERLPSQAKLVQIEGANHASFGNYGSQPLDTSATNKDSDTTEVITKSLKDFIN